MGPITKKRSIVAAIAAAAMTALGQPAVAGAATETYPAGGSAFTGGMQGWTGSGESCAPVQGADITCSTTAEHSATVGNPAGSINSRITTLVNAGGLLKGETTFTSPTSRWQRARALARARSLWTAGSTAARRPRPGEHVRGQPGRPERREHRDQGAVGDDR